MKIICIGRNYDEHARELGNPRPSEPVVFMKPETALIRDGKPFFLPDHLGEVHHEIELVLRIGRNGRHIQPKFALSYIDRVALGIDFTARQLQENLKSKGLPWELAKGFDGSAILGDWQETDASALERGYGFTLQIGDEIRQSGHTSDMLFGFGEIIAFVSQYFTLKMGDILYTGTPSGVGPVQIGDRLTGSLDGRVNLRCKIC
jgi:2-keto-4-pentenoate hydratase/2-oxohepta-3-ene-1,7-dioic acid hydratase in catechol pathway